MRTKDLSLQDIIAVHTRTLADHLEEFLPLIRLLRLVGEGPISLEQVATRMHGTPQQVTELLQASGLVVDAEGAIQTVTGTGCALDTLLFPMLTGRSSQVSATCKTSGKPIRLTVTEQTIADVDPPGAVLSLRLPGEATDAENMQATICAYGHFFVDREHALT